MQSDLVLTSHLSFLQLSIYNTQHNILVFVRLLGKNVSSDGLKVDVVVCMYKLLLFELEILQYFLTRALSR